MPQLSTTLFNPTEITAAKLKMAFMGFQGSGKTYTATEVAIGLTLMMAKLKLPAGERPIFFADTERSSRWVLPQVTKAGLTMATSRTRAFADLINIVNQAEQGASVLIIDSLTHFWTEFCDSYAAKKAAQYKIPTYRLQFQDWAYLKAEWRKFTDRFVNSDVSIICCGRAGFEYDMIEDEDTHKKQLEKTGIKMKAEGEMGYEPDLLVLIERRMDMETKQDLHIAHVVKDRSTLLDGKEFANPTFKDFKPHIDCLHLEAGAAEISIDTSRTSTGIIPADAPRDRVAMQRAIILDEINDLLMRNGAAGTAKDAQLKRSDLLKKHFGTVSKTAIEEQLPMFDLKAGYDSMHMELEGTPSRYGAPKIEVAQVTQTKAGAVVEGALEGALINSQGAVMVTIKGHEEDDTAIPVDRVDTTWIDQFMGYAQ